MFQYVFYSTLKDGLLQSMLDMVQENLQSIVILVMMTIFGPTFFAATAHAVIQWLVDIIFPLL